MHQPRSDKSKKYLSSVCGVIRTVFKCLLIVSTNVRYSFCGNMFANTDGNAALERDERSVQSGSFGVRIWQVCLATDSSESRKSFNKEQRHFHN